MKKGMRRSTLLAKEGGTFTMPGGFKVKVEILDKSDAKDQMGNQVLAQYFQEDHIISLKRSRTLNSAGPI